MASTTFIDNQTVIYAAWLNDVNNVVYNGIFQSASITATSIVCNGTASGAGFTNLINNTFTSPGPFGSVTPNTGKFTTLQATSLTGLTTPLSVGQGGTGLTSPGSSGSVLTSNGSAWIAQAAPASSLGTSGYQKLASGLIMQWGTTSSISVYGNVTVTYPIAFPTAVFVVMVTPY
jgi:hypothetical protein